MKRHKKSSSHGNLWLAISLFVLCISLLWNRHEQTKLSFVPSTIDAVYINDRNYQPEYITIESANIYLPVKQTAIHEGIWTVAEDGASHLTSSASPGVDGNIIIYAHNTTDRFGSLSTVTKGTPIIIQTRSGKRFTYTVYKTEIVSPSDVEILRAQNPEELTLYTCYGFADLKRFVVKAIPSTQDTPQLTIDR